MVKQTLDRVSELNRLINDEIHQIENPVDRAMALVGDKYSFQIIQILCQKGRQRFVELEAQVNGISPRTLSARLKHLERYGIIDRHQFPTIPPRVEYELTEKGEALRPALDAMQAWANEWFPHHSQMPTTH
ncbi:MAG: helix-turn-helix domain-containing protein [Vampirovibrionales bacterium]